jgi:hypothetical protein
MKRIFISGKMTGIENFNYPLFNKIAAELRALGHTVENPAENKEQDTWEDYMRLALRQMLTCDVVAQLPGWEDSRGARMEHDVADELGIPCVSADSLLKDCSLNLGLLANQAANRSPRDLLNFALKRLNLKNDFALAMYLDMSPATLSKVRNRVVPVGDTLLVDLSEALDMPTKHLKAIAGVLPGVDIDACHRKAHERAAA